MKRSGNPCQKRGKTPIKPDGADVRTYAIICSIKLINRIKISEKILIAILPVIGYVAGYFYQIGYYSQFSLPIYLIKVNVEYSIVATLLIAAITIIVAFIYLIINTSPPKDTKKNIESNKNPSLLRYIIACISFGLFMGIFSYNAHGVNLLIRILLPPLSTFLFAVVIFIPPLINYPNTKGYRNKFAKSLEADQIRILAEKEKKAEEAKKNNIQFKLPSDPNILTLTVLAIFFFYIISMAFLIGAVVSGSNQYYYTIKKAGSDFIVFQQGDNQFVAIKVNKLSRKTEPIFLLLPSNQPILLIGQNLGQLNTPSESKNFKP